MPRLWTLWRMKQWRGRKEPGVRAISLYAQHSSEMTLVIKKGEAEEAILCWEEGLF